MNTLPLGPAIVYARAASGMSQRDVQPNNMVRIERGTVSPTFAVALRIIRKTGAKLIMVTSKGDQVEIVPDSETDGAT